MTKHKVLTSVAILGVAALAALAIVVRAPEHTQTVEAGVPWFVSNVVVSNPKDPEVRTYEPGTALNFRADFVWTYCSNEGGGQVFGRITRPVPVGSAHTAFGPWRNASEGQQIAPTNQRVLGQGKGRERVRLVRPPVQVYKPRAGSFVQPMSLPTKPGRYHFQYQIQIRTPQGNLPRTGRVVFEIKEREVTCPANQIEITRNGNVVCVPNTLSLTCSAAPARVDVGESVTFTANASQSASFTWYNGSGASGSVIGGPQTGTQSTLTRTFSAPGVYQVTAVAQNANGYGICTRGVTVGDVPDDENLEGLEEVIDDFGNVVTDESITLPDGRKIMLNPSAGNATITFELDKTLTNDTCGATWNAQNVAQCYLVKNNDKTAATAIVASGTDDIEPATYRVSCIALKDGSIVSSEERLCRRNPEVREY